MSVGTLSLCYRSYSLSRTLSYCSPAFHCKIRIANMSFAALFQVECSSYDSLVWHTLVFYLVVLIEHMVDWNIQTRLSGERPRKHGVRLSVAYSTPSLKNGRACITGLCRRKGRCPMLRNIGRFHVPTDT